MGYAGLMKLLALFLSLSGFGFFHDLFYVPAYLASLELLYPGMWDSLKDEKMTRIWLVSASECAVDFLMLLALERGIYLGRRFLLPALKRRLGFVQAHGPSSESHLLIR